MYGHEIGEKPNDPLSELLVDHEPDTDYSRNLRARIGDQYDDEVTLERAEAEALGHVVDAADALLNDNDSEAHLRNALMQLDTCQPWGEDA